jgi:hypothetical protein
MPHTQINPILAQARKQVGAEQAATATPETAADPLDISSALVSAPSGGVASISASLLAVQEAAGTAVTRSVNAIIDLEIGAKESKQASDVMISAISDVTAANQIIQRTKDTANLQAQNATIDAFEVGGGVEGQTALMAELTADNARVDAIVEENVILSQEDRFGEGVGLLDTIINKFNTNLNRNQLAAAVAKQASTQTKIANITGATEAFARVNALTKKTLNEATIEANYKVIVAEGDIKASQARIQNISTNATAMLNLMQADSSVTSNLLQSYRLEGEADERALKIERQKFLREQMVHEREQWELKAPKAAADLEKSLLLLEQAQTLGPTQIAQAELNLARTTKEHNDTIALEDSLVESVQRGQSLAGVPVEDKETVLFGLRNTTSKAKYSRLQEMGGTPDAVLGLTPAEAKESIDVVAPSGNIKPNKGTKLLAQIAEKQAQKYAKPDAKVPRDQVSLNADFNQTADEFIAEKVISIATGDASNPYSAPPFTVLEQSADLQLQPLYRKVLQAMQLKETNPQTILDAAIAGVLAKTVTPEEAAAGITAVFDLAALINNTQDGGFRRVGLPNQTTYNAKINRAPTFFEQLKIVGTTVKPDAVLGILGGAKLALAPDSVLTKTLITIDLMDETKVQQLIIESLSSTPAAAPSTETTTNP